MRKTFWGCALLFILVALAAGGWALRRRAAELPPPMAAESLAVPAPARPIARVAPPPVPARPSQQALQRESAPPAKPAAPVWQAARAYRTGKSNIYFSRTELLQDLLAHDEEAVQHLSEALAAAPGTDAAEDAPNAEVSDRMAAIDLLEAFVEERITATHQAQARGALRALALQELPVALDAARKGVMVAEKYDAFTALTRQDPALAFDAYRALESDARRAVLEPALLAGLIDRGVPRGEVTAEFARLAAAKFDRTNALSGSGG